TFDVGRYAVLLEGTGALSIDTIPSGAEVTCARFEARGLVYPTTDERALGTTPLSRVPLECGSHLITLRYPGRADVVYPVHITRCHHWQAAAPVPLPEREDPRFAYVAPGPFVCGGDPEAPGSAPRTQPTLDGFFIARLPVTMEEYLAFLNDLHEHDPAEAWARVPRSEASLVQSDGQYFARPRSGKPYLLPDTDSEGNDWDPRWPVFGVSWRDAEAYAAWASSRDGVRYRLPREKEFEKAARGVDGRFYPWGDGFDRTLCKMGDSRRGRARPEAVGTFKTDVSVYGVRDTAGSMRDWCGDASFDDDQTLRPVRGGSWNYDPRFCRSACRLGRAPWRVFAYNGFRLAHDLADDVPGD
ncbi:MAG: SUMF1/EgtB/PvdO family nonheme iron enzyme, partial [Polyangiaceae bacterium]